MRTQTLLPLQSGRQTRAVVDYFELKVVSALGAKERTGWTECNFSESVHRLEAGGTCSGHVLQYLSLWASGRVCCLLQG